MTWRFFAILSSCFPPQRSYFTVNLSALSPLFLAVPNRRDGAKSGVNSQLFFATTQIVIRPHSTDLKIVRRFKNLYAEQKEPESSGFVTRPEKGNSGSLTLEAGFLGYTLQPEGQPSARKAAPKTLHCSLTKYSNSKNPLIVKCRLCLLTFFCRPAWRPHSSCSRWCSGPTL